MHQLNHSALQVQIETYGSMEKREKAEFILEQVTYTLKGSNICQCRLLSCRFG
jgi:hypothetical protein